VATPAQPTVYPDVFATAATQLFATAAAGPGARPTPTPVPVATVAVDVALGQPAGGLYTGPGVYLTLALLAGAWAWRSGRLPVWGAERWALALPWRRDDADARRRCRWQGRDWLIRGVLPDAFWRRPPWWPLVPARKGAYLAVLAGEEGSGKSYLLTYLAVCAVLGLDFLGVPTRRLRAVVYADSELDVATFWQRVAAVVAGLRLADPAGAFRECRRRIAYVCLRDHGETLYVPSAQERAQGLRPAGMTRIRRLVRWRRAGLALVDGLTTGAGAAESDGQAASRLVLALEALGCAVVAIDHTNSRGQQAGSANKRRLERVKYLLTRVGKGRPDDGRRRLVIDKASFTGKESELRYVCAFHPGGDGELGPVTFTTGGGGEGAGEGRGEGAEGPLRPRPLGPSGEPRTPGPGPHDSPREGASGVGAGVGGHQGAKSRATQGQPQRKAYPVLLAAVQRRGPGATVSYEALAAETGYARGTVVNRTGELVKLGRLAPGPDGTVRLPPAESA
jgi:hypothetical protein